MQSQMATEVVDDMQNKYRKRTRSMNTNEKCGQEESSCIEEGG